MRHFKTIQIRNLFLNRNQTLFCFTLPAWYTCIRNGVLDKIGLARIQSNFVINRLRNSNDLLSNQKWSQLTIDYFRLIRIRNYFRIKRFEHPLTKQPNNWHMFILKVPIYVICKFDVSLLLRSSSFLLCDLGWAKCRRAGNLFRQSKAIKAIKRELLLHFLVHSFTALKQEKKKEKKKKHWNFDFFFWSFAGWSRIPTWAMPGSGEIHSTPETQVSASQSTDSSSFRLLPFDFIHHQHHHYHHPSRFVLNQSEHFYSLFLLPRRPWRDAFICARWLRCRLNWLICMHRSIHGRRKRTDNEWSGSSGATTRITCRNCLFVRKQTGSFEWDDPIGQTRADVASLLLSAHPYFMSLHCPHWRLKAFRFVTHSFA